MVSLILFLKKERGNYMKEIKIMKNAVIVYFYTGVSIKLPGTLEYADSRHVQTKDGNGYHTITIDGFDFSYEDMPFSMRV